MSDQIQTGAEDNIFDPPNFVTTTALNGKRAFIKPGAMFVRRGYKLGEGQDQTFLVLNVIGQALTKPRQLLISCGALMPGVIENGVKVRATSGPFLVGGKVEKNSNISTFLQNLKASGFNMAEMGSKGATALDGADITWKAVEKKINNELKPYDMPAEFHGYGTPEAIAAADATPADISGGTADGVVTAPDGATQVVNATPEELEAQAVDALSRAVLQFGEIPRGQISIKTGPLLAQNPNRVQILSLLTKDDVISKVPNTVYDRKTIKPVAAVAS